MINLLPFTYSCLRTAPEESEGRRLDLFRVPSTVCFRRPLRSLAAHTTALLLVLYCRIRSHMVEYDRIDEF